MMEDIYMNIFYAISIYNALVVIASAIVAATPWDKDDIALGKFKAFVMPIISKLSLQIGYAKK
jgi:hypothetical protein